MTNNSSTGDALKPAKKFTKRELSLLRLKRKIFSHTKILRVLLMFALIVLLAGVILFIGRLIPRTGTNEYFKFTKGFLFPSSTNIQSFKGRINILIMGKGGVGHSAPDLTDTMMFVSIGVRSPGIVLVSIPRDIWVPSIRAKINSAYYWGKEKQQDGGLILSKSLVEEIVGVPIEYAAVLDFSAFKEVVDSLGGIEVNVEKTFTDNHYPIAGKENDLCGGDKDYKCRYETIAFNQGLQVMNGDMALKFVRSRYAEGDEGTDIARDLRQQKVITAIKEKLLKPSTFLNVGRMLTLKNILMHYIETDIDTISLGTVARRILAGRSQIKSNVIGAEFLDNPPISPKYDNQYVFIPKTGSWDTVHKWVDNLLSQ